MKKRKYLLVIPARLKSKRFYAKPLKKIIGIPMIIRTARQCEKAVHRKDIVIATDSNKIKKICEEYGYKSIITKKKVLTGTDRVSLVSKEIYADYYINIQGDEPIFNPSDIKIILKKIKKNQKKLLLGFTKITNSKDVNNVNIPKVCFDKKLNLIYASRLPVPFNFKKKSEHYRQVLAYSFPRNKLLQFSSLSSKGIIENSENIEILRFLENGLKVKLIKMSSRSKSVDTPEDLKRVEKILKKH